jgi:hypothetical protein
MSPSFPPLNPGSLIANLVALIVIAVGIDWGLDKLWLAFGHTPWALCVLLPVLDNISRLVGLILAVVGFVGAATSRDNRGGYITLLVAGVFLPLTAGVFLHYLGSPGCGAS